MHGADSKRAVRQQTLGGLALRTWRGWRGIVDPQRMWRCAQLKARNLAAVPKSQTDVRLHAAESELRRPQHNENSASNLHGCKTRMCRAGGRVEHRYPAERPMDLLASQCRVHALPEAPHGAAHAISRLDIDVEVPDAWRVPRPEVLASDLVFVVPVARNPDMACKPSLDKGDPAFVTLRKAPVVDGAVSWKRIDQRVVRFYAQHLRASVVANVLIAGRSYGLREEAVRQYSRVASAYPRQQSVGDIKQSDGWAKFLSPLPYGRSRSLYGLHFSSCLSARASGLAWPRRCVGS
jgi:hypothetical protein